MKRPWQITVLSVLFGIAGALNLFDIVREIYKNGWSVFVVINIPTVLNFATAYGLWTLKNWGRILALIVCVLGIIAAFGMGAALIIPLFGGAKVAPFPIPFVVLVVLLTVFFIGLVGYLRKESVKILFRPMSQN